MSDIGIAITTFNRPELFKKTLEKHIEHLPKGAKLVIVEDCHTECEPYTTGYRFTERAGIPKMKNKCLELLEGCDEIFLFDDDTFPVAKDWHIPYIHTKGAHKCYTFLGAIERNDGTIKTHQLGNGCMLYMNRVVINKIGGFDERFGIGKYEHVQFSHRARAAGLTPHPFIDVVGSNKLICCLDQLSSHESHKRTLTPKEQHELIVKNSRHFDMTRNSTEYIPYK